MTRRMPAGPMVAAELAAAMPPVRPSILDRVFPPAQCAEVPWAPAAPIYGAHRRLTERTTS